MRQEYLSGQSQGAYGENETTMGNTKGHHSYGMQSESSQDRETPKNLHLNDQYNEKFVKNGKNEKSKNSKEEM